MFFDYEAYTPDWDGDWCGTGPIVPLPDPEPDPWPELREGEDLFAQLEEHGLWPFPDKPVEASEFLGMFVAEFEHALEGLESEDRLGNHEIQRLMQIMNHADTFASKVREKTDDTENTIIGKI